MKKNSPEYKLATSMWILSCTDRPSEMTYQSIEERIDNGAKNLAREIVAKFPELFQENIRKDRFENWKLEMLEGRQRPRWIANSNNQKEIINNLKLTDVFQNRFRSSDDQSTTDPEILKWGLEYLNEHYSLKTIESDRKWDRFKNTFIPILSLLVAAMSVYFSYSSSYDRLRFEHIKLEREMVIPNYHIFLNSMTNSLHTGRIRGDVQYSIEELSKARSALHALSPFLPEKDYDLIKENLTDYHIILLELHDNDSLTEKSKSDLAQAFSNVVIHFSQTIKEKLEVEETKMYE